METPLYKIEEESTSGWHEVGTSLTRDECEQIYNSLLDDGVNPNRIKIARIS